MERDQLIHKISRIIAPEVLQALSKAIQESTNEAYIIGGFVRDLYMDRPSKDIDIVVDGDGLSFAELTAKALGREKQVSYFKNFGTAQLKYKGMEIEFVGARKESYSPDSRKPIVDVGTLQDDQKRRDFTINALAVSVNDQTFGDIVDPFNGIQDIEQGRIVTPLDPDITFSDDPLRMMRAVRFACQLNFRIDDVTFEAIIRNKERIHIISQERIIDEINKIMLSRTPSIGWVLLDESGLLEIILPELYALKGVETKEGKGHKDNFYHTLQVLDKVAERSDNLWLRWAALFHDIGKPIVKRWDKKTGWTFHNHNYMGAKIIPSVFQRMKLPLNDKMKFVRKLVDLHMRPIALVEDVVTDSAVRRLLFDASDDIEALMILCKADITSKNQEKVKRFLQNFELVEQKLKEIEQKDRIRNFQPPITGEEIMKIFALEPCHTVGQIKAAIKDAILEGLIPNEYEPAYIFMVEEAKRYGLSPQ